MRKLKFYIMSGLLCLVTIFGALIISNINKTNLYANEIIEAEQNCCRRLEVQEEYARSSSSSEDSQPASDSDLPFRAYKKGDQVVNVLFNFVNYSYKIKRQGSPCLYLCIT